MKQLLKDAAFRGELIENAPMRSYTTFRIGGPAELLAIASSESDVRVATEVCHQGGIPFFVLGNGSNLLVRDGGLDGLVLQIGQGMQQVEVDGDTITAQAGVPLSRLAQVACANGLSGLEFAAGIPGTLGGAVAMNAGAYGGQMSDVLREVTAVTRSGEPLRLSLEALCLGYRSSIIMRRGDIVTGARMTLARGDRTQIAARIAELNARRREKQPLTMPSAGSVFKRPEGFFAGDLIERAGCKGLAIGDAMVSPLHAGFIVNKGNASARDVEFLIAKIQQSVYERFHVSLECEVRIIGKERND